MNMKTTVPLAVAVVLGLVAAIVASQLVKQHPVAVGLPGQAAVMNLSEVVVAAHDVAPGTALSTDDLKVLRIESANVPANVSSNPSSLFGRVAKVQIPAGQIVHNSLLAERGVAAGLPGVIPAGFRAMTIEINEFTGVAGLLEPGNRIDILARVLESDGGSTQMTRTIAQNVPILAVGPNLTNKQANPNSDAAIAAAPVISDAPQAQKVIARSITLLVTPEDAEKIDLASSSNGARIVLRASNDNDTSKAPGATVASLRGSSVAGHLPTEPGAEVAAGHKTPQQSPADSVFGPGTKPVFKPTGNTRTITVIRAGAITTVDVEDPNAEAGTTAGDNASAGGGDLLSPR